MTASRDRPVLHVAARLEDRAQAVVGAGLRRAGWTPLVEPYVGYGLAGHWVRVLGRVLLRPPSYDASAAREAQRGFRRFLTHSAPEVPLTIRVGGVSVEVCCSRDGYVDERIEVALEPGWTTAEIVVPGAEPVAADLHVVGPDTSLGLLSDIDDTVMITMLPRPLVAFRNAFLRREGSRRPVPGMAALYDEVVVAHPDVFVVYLSTGAWNAAPALRRFLAHHGYPRGPLLLTDWGPTPTAWFRSGQEHKRTQLTRLLADLPALRWVLVGDDGQHDPSLYAEVAAAHPDRVHAVAIRQLSAGEQVRTHGSPTPQDAPHGPGGAVAWVEGPEGGSLTARLRALGLL